MFERKRIHLTDDVSTTVTVRGTPQLRAPSTFMRFRKRIKVFIGSFISHYLHKINKERKV